MCHNGVSPQPRTFLSGQAFSTVLSLGGIPNPIHCQLTLPETNSSLRPRKLTETQKEAGSSPFAIFFSVAMFMLVLGQSVSVDDFYATNQPFLLLFCVLSLSRWISPGSVGSLGFPLCSSSMLRQCVAGGSCAEERRGTQQMVGEPSHSVEVGLLVCLSKISHFLC